jgi:phosphatidate cytidylyltransferase
MARSLALASERRLLTQRVASAAVGVPAILAIIYIGGNWYVGVVAAALAIASLEFNHVRRDWFDPVCVLTALLVAGVAVGAHTGDYRQYIWFGAALAIPPIAVTISPTENGALDDAAWIAFGVTYVGILGSFLVQLRDVDFDGRDWVYLTALSTFAVDTAAFFTGRAIGRRLLAPSISPKKTWEGFFGGWGAGFAAVATLGIAFDLTTEPWKLALLGLLLPLAAAAGDLAESAMKRRMHIKDASELIPGHGGVLDRLDSILFTFALVYVFTQLVF